jgi:hypothetical protein
MAPTFRIDVRADLKGLTRDLDALQRRQIPFASALTLTAVARIAAKAEEAQLAKSFDRPTPFTGRAFGVIPATKSSQTATLFVKDIQAAYLAPYIVGGKQALGSKAAILTPRDLPTNAYGNLPRGKLASLKGRPDIFVGEVKMAGGMVGGVWQRVTVTRGKRGFRKLRGVAQPTRQTGGLRLLIQFTRPATVTHRFHYEQTAAQAVRAALAAEWDRAFARATATAR